MLLGACLSFSGTEKNVSTPNKQASKLLVFAKTHDKSCSEFVALLCNFNAPESCKHFGFL